MLEYFEEFLAHFQLPLESPILVFSLILSIILLSPILLGRLNIPGIIGLIIAGIVIGPHGFNVIENNSAIELFSTIGLLYIMFIAGLELDLKEFSANRNKSLLFGLFTFAIPLAIGYPIVRYGLGYDFNASFLTASMFATHTLVAYPIVSRMGVSKNQAVAITVGGTILTDTAVLIILAVIMGNATGNLNSEFWITLGISLTIFSVIMFFIIPRIAKWFFKKLEGEKHSHYIFVLSVVFFAAFLAEVAGVEAIIGAFMAGLALNKLIPHDSPLMNRIEFLGNSLFIPFFLISVGMLVDVSVIFNGIDAWIVAGTLTVVAVFGKWLAAWFTQLAFKYSRAQRQMIFGLSGAHAAATLAVILVGYRTVLEYGPDGEPIRRLLDENILNGTIILILIASIIASFATEKAAKKIVIESENDVEGLARSSGATSEHILVPIDNITKFRYLLEFALNIKNKKSPNPISALTVVANNEEVEEDLDRAKTKLQTVLDEMEQEGSNKSKLKVNVLTTIDHNAATGITRVSRETMADVLVLGWPGKSGFLDRFVGAEKIDNIVNATTKTAFVCHLKDSLSSHQRIVILAPPLAEKEVGFTVWLSKIIQLAIETKLPILLFSNQKTNKVVIELLDAAKSTVTILHKECSNFEQLDKIKSEVEPTDLVVLISARKGAKSYTRLMDHLPSKLDKMFAASNYIVVFPQHYTDFNLKDTDVSGEPIERSIEVVQNIGKGIGSILRRKKDSN